MSSGVGKQVICLSCQANIRSRTNKIDQQTQSVSQSMREISVSITVKNLFPQTRSLSHDVHIISWRSHRCDQEPPQYIMQKHFPKEQSLFKPLKAPNHFCKIHSFAGRGESASPLFSLLSTNHSGCSKWEAYFQRVVCRTRKHSQSTTHYRWDVNQITLFSLIQSQ